MTCGIFLSPCRTSGIPLCPTRTSHFLQTPLTQRHCRDVSCPSSYSLHHFTLCRESVGPSRTKLVWPLGRTPEPDCPHEWTPGPAQGEALGVLVGWSAVRQGAAEACTGYLNCLHTASRRCLQPNNPIPQSQDQWSTGVWGFGVGGAAPGTAGGCVRLGGGHSMETGPTSMTNVPSSENREPPKARRPAQTASDRPGR